MPNQVIEKTFNMLLDKGIHEGDFRAVKAYLILIHSVNEEIDVSLWREAISRYDLNR